MKPDATICPKCGLAVPSGIATCPEDGHPLAEALRPFEARRDGRSGREGWDDPPGRADELEPTVRRAPPPERPPSVTLRRDPLIGQALGEYVVEELIGVGGMGLVYRGLQPMIGKPVAIKILRPEISDSPTHVERLLAEARAVNAVRHRGIIDIFNFGRLSDGRQYLVMEFLQGKALDEYIFERGALIPSEAVTLLQEIASALSAAHEAGVVHRDLKPNNIFLVKQSGGQYVKLLDFGLAKQTAPHGTTPQTHAGLVVGTPEYMAPEQARGEEIGPKTDLYALGVVAFQTLTGQLPFTASSPMEFLVRHLEYAPPKVIQLMPDVPEELSDLVDQLLMKAPADRPSSADQVRRELRRIARLIPQDVTYVGPDRGPPQPAPGTRDANVIVSPSLASKTSAGTPPQAGRTAHPAKAPTPPVSPVSPVTKGARPHVSATTETTPGQARRPSVLVGVGVGALLLLGGAVAAVSFSGRREALPVTAIVAPEVPAGVPPEVSEAVPEPVAQPQPAPAPVAPEPQPEPVRVAPAKAEPKPKEAIAQAATEAVVKPKPRPAAPKVSPLEQSISRRISQLAAALPRRQRLPELETKARFYLESARTQLKDAKDDDARRRVARELDLWEQRYLLPSQ